MTGENLFLYTITVLGYPSCSSQKGKYSRGKEEKLGFIMGRLIFLSVFTWKYMMDENENLIHCDGIAA